MVGLRVPKNVQLQQWTLTVLEMPVPGDSHQKYQLQWNGAGWDLKDRLSKVVPKRYFIFDIAGRHLRDFNFLITVKSIDIYAYKMFYIVNVWT